jgi:hypothetical protein
MPPSPDPAELYPDVAAQASLAAALQAVAAEHGLSLGDVIVNERQPLSSATISSATALRDPLGIIAGADERIWMINGWGQGIWLVGGKTRDLVEVARAGQSWRDGVPLREIRRRVPFVELTSLAEAAEQGPGHVVAAEWRQLRQDAAEVDLPGYRALIEAAHAEPRLRQLYPYTSHGMLRFSTTTGYPFSPDLVCLQASRDRFIVRESWMGQALGETATAEEAVLLAVGHLPAQLGPAVAGAYRASPSNSSNS